jgi:hypothetical protein
MKKSCLCVYCGHCRKYHQNMLGKCSKCEKCAGFI